MQDREQDVESGDPNVKPAPAPRCVILEKRLSSSVPQFPHWKKMKDITFHRVVHCQDDVPFISRGLPPSPGSGVGSNCEGLRHWNFTELHSNSRLEL